MLHACPYCPPIRSKRNGVSLAFPFLIIHSTLYGYEKRIGMRLYVIYSARRCIKTNWLEKVQRCSNAQVIKLALVPRQNNISLPATFKRSNGVDIYRVYTCYAKWEVLTPYLADVYPNYLSAVFIGPSLLHEQVAHILWGCH